MLFRSLLSFSLFLISVLTLSACGQGQGTDESLLYGRTPGTFSQRDVTYAVLRDAILKPQCFSCHQEFGSERELLNSIGSAGDPIVVAGRPELSSLFTWVQSGRMPRGKPRLQTGDVEMFRSYILNLNAQPEPSATPTPTSTPEPAPAPRVTFAQLKTAIIDNQCLRCHNNFDTEPNLLAAKNELEELMILPGRSDQSPFYIEVRDGRMPKRKPGLSPAEVELIRNYIDGLTP